MRFSRILILGIFTIAWWTWSTLPAASQSLFWQEMHKGRMNFQRGRAGQAMVHYDRALRLDSTNMTAHFNLADAALACDSVDRALSEYELVAKRSQDTHLRALSHHNMGVIYQAMAGLRSKEHVRQEYLKKAIAQYKQSLRLDPKSDPTRYNLALCMKQLKDENSNNNNQPTPPKSEKDKEQPPQSKPENQPQKPPQPSPQRSQMLEYAKRKEQNTRRKINRRYMQPPKTKNW